MRHTCGTARTPAATFPLAGGDKPGGPYLFEAIGVFSLGGQAHLAPA